MKLETEAAIPTDDNMTVNEVAWSQHLYAATSRHEECVIDGSSLSLCPQQQ